MNRSLRTSAFLPLLALLLAQSACVTKGKYQTAVDELAQARAEHDQTLTAEQRARADQVAQLERDLESVRRELARTEADLIAEERRATDLRNRLNTEMANREEMQERLSQTGDEADNLRRRLAALAAVEVEIRNRNQIYEEMLGRFRSMIDAGQLSIAIVRGRMVLQLPQDVLFDSGSATLNREGRSTLGQIGAVLSEITDRRFQVEGHTDDVPISTSRFPSNWELSAGRSLAVVRLLLEEGMDPTNISGAAYGEHQPVADNDSADGRRQNRRIEIVMLPNLNVVADLGEGSGR